MRISAGLANNNLPAVPERIAAIEAAGFDLVTVAENAHDPFLPLALAAVHSERVELATGVAIAFPRSPMMTAQLGWDLQAASNAQAYWCDARHSQRALAGAMWVVWPRRL